jgi:hypothetical protein
LKPVKRSRPNPASRLKIVDAQSTDPWEQFLQLWWVIGFDTLDKFPLAKAEYYEQMRRDLLEFLSTDDFKK